MNEVYIIIIGYDCQGCYVSRIHDVVWDRKSALNIAKNYELVDNDDDIEVYRYMQNSLQEKIYYCKR
jgi:hypothetical protein